jgi:hypothetical protein
MLCGETPLDDTIAPPGSVSAEENCCPKGSACPVRAGNSFAIGNAGKLAAADTTLSTELTCVTGKAKAIGFAVTAAGKAAELFVLPATPPALFAGFRDGRLIVAFELAPLAAELPGGPPAPLPSETVADTAKAVFTAAVGGVDNPRCTAASVDANPPPTHCAEPAWAPAPGSASRLPAGARLLEMDSNPRFTAFTQQVLRGCALVNALR